MIAGNRTSDVTLPHAFSLRDPMPVRALSTADVPDIQRLAALADAEGFRFLGRFLAEVEAGRTQLDGAASRFIGIDDSGQLVALGGVTPDPYTADSRVGRVRHLYVQPDHR